MREIIKINVAWLTAAMPVNAPMPFVMPIRVPESQVFCIQQLIATASQLPAKFGARSSAFTFIPVEKKIRKIIEHVQVKKPIFRYQSNKRP